MVNHKLPLVVHTEVLRWQLPCTNFSELMTTPDIFGKLIETMNSMKIIYPPLMLL